jgi:hypothetical protein
MSTHHSQSDAITAAKRRSVAARRVGIGNACVCGENRPLALVAGSNPTTCADCKRRQKGQSPFDAHHVAGKVNHPLTIPVPANDHRAILSEEQYNWPKATRENADGSPLLAIAGCIRGLYDTIVYLLQKLLLWIPEILEKLDAFLTMRLGAAWWCNEDYVNFTKGGR